MNFPTLLAGLVLSGSAHAVTLGTSTLPADENGGAVTLFYPTAAAGKPETRGDLQLMLAPDAPPAPALGNGRLIAISHGSGGGPWVQTTLAKALVEAGFVVVLPLHRGDNWQDEGHPGPDSWKQRPAEISHAVDRVASDSRFAALKLDRVGVFGMSAGGHTALTLAGGAWSPERFRAHCERHLAEDFQACIGLATRLTGGPLDGLKLWLAQRVLNWKFGGDTRPQTHLDSRIAAVVAGVPLAADFDLATLARPRVPLGLITATDDRWLRPRFHSDPLRAACQACELLADLPGAGHGALLAPLPSRKEFSALACELMCDPPGFDRPAATARWVGATVDFFRRHLLSGAAPQPELAQQALLVEQQHELGLGRVDGGGDEADEGHEVQRPGQAIAVDVVQRRPAAVKAQHAADAEQPFGLGPRRLAGLQQLAGLGGLEFADAAVADRGAGREGRTQADQPQA